MTAKRDKGIVGKSGSADRAHINLDQDDKPIVGEGISFTQSKADTNNKIDHATAQERKN